MGPVVPLSASPVPVSGATQSFPDPSRRYRIEPPQPNVLLLAERQGDAVGYVSAVRQMDLWMGRDILALDDLYVRESARGQGVGEQVMCALASHAAADQLLIRWGLRERPHDYAARLAAR